MTYETRITIESIPGGPGYIADITGHLADPECDPRGVGQTRLAAALDLARNLLERAEEGETMGNCICLAIAAVLREDLETFRDGPTIGMVTAYERAIAMVEGLDR